jgi:hypothetical protein
MKKLLLNLAIFMYLLFPNIAPAQQDNTQGSTKPVQQEFIRDEVEQALNSDLVIIGIVKDILDTPGKTSEMFHSMVIIHIDSVLRGKINYENITIRLESGPVTDDIHGGVRIWVSDEPNFSIGEKVVLFLKNTKNDPYLNSGHAKKNFTSYGGKKDISELPDDTFWASKTSVFEIKNGMIFYFNKIINESDFISNIIKQK